MLHTILYALCYALHHTGIHYSKQHYTILHHTIQYTLYTMLYIILYILYSNYTITSRAVPDPSVNPVEDPNVVEEIIEENKKVVLSQNTTLKPDAPSLHL